MTENTRALRERPEPPALPVKVDDWKRMLRIEVSFNDLVEQVHLALVEDTEYLRLLYAVWDSQAVEGSLAADNFAAAGRIRDKAKEMGLAMVGTSNIATISKALGVVLRRYGSSRTPASFGRHSLGIN